MLKKILSIVAIVILASFIFPASAKAVYDPSMVSNNRFGVHVVDANNLRDVAQLVNSNGGDWGYVTIVIQNGERDTKKWQAAMDEMRRLHLIPIIRIASAPIGNNWSKLNSDEIDGWVSFLNSLNWVIKNRYITVGNEPNHSQEWGGEINPKEYGDYLKTFSMKLKLSNDNFFIMPAGMDASAANTRDTMDEALYLQKMFDNDSHVFDYIDGWASHSYPNPDFSGPGNATGRGTVSTFIWELDYLKYLGFQKDLPVFITETGWTHDIDRLTTDIGPKIELAFNDIWGDKRVVAVTPFIFKYTESPFDIFSWQNKEGQFYDFYTNVLNLKKTKGRPIQEVKGSILTGILPKVATINSSYRSIIFAENTGQSIWQINNIGAIDGLGNRLTVESVFPPEVEPKEIAVILVDGKFPQKTGNFITHITLVSNNKNISNNIVLTTNLIPKLPSLIDIFNYLKLEVIKRIN